MLEKAESDSGLEKVLLEMRARAKARALCFAQLIEQINKITNPFFRETTLRLTRGMSGVNEFVEAYVSDFAKYNSAFSKDERHAVMGEIGTFDKNLEGAAVYAKNVLDKALNAGAIDTETIKYLAGGSGEKIRTPLFVTYVVAGKMMELAGKHALAEKTNQERTVDFFEFARQQMRKDVVSVPKEESDAYYELEKYKPLIDVKSNHIASLQISSQELTGIPGPVAELKGLQRLVLPYNKIKRIEHLGNLAQLEELDLYSNRISRIEGLDNLVSLRLLNLGCNQISRIEGLDNLAKLHSLIVRSNKISKLDGLGNQGMLKKLQIGMNPIDFQDPDIVKVVNEFKRRGVDVYL
jgi:hypothetical protein